MSETSQHIYIWNSFSNNPAILSKVIVFIWMVEVLRKKSTSRLDSLSPENEQTHRKY